MQRRLEGELSVHPGLHIALGILVRHVDLADAELLCLLIAQQQAGVQFPAWSAYLPSNNVSDVGTYWATSSTLSIDSPFCLIRIATSEPISA